MFEYPEIKNANSYKIQIIEHYSLTNFKNQWFLLSLYVKNPHVLNPFFIIFLRSLYKEFKFSWFYEYFTSIWKQKVIEQTDNTTATLINGLKFGNQYKWKYTALNKKGDIIYSSNFFYFETLNSKLIDQNYFRYKLIKNEVKDGLIFLDGAQIAINRKGEPIWFNPLGLEEPTDIQITKIGTITLLIKYKDIWSRGIELSLDGKILWDTPKSKVTVSGDTISCYHHDFKKLDNGNYMIMGYKRVKPKIELNTDKICYGTLIEFDSNRNIVWSWDSQKYISDTDVYYPYKMVEIPPYEANNIKVYDIMHANSFYYDEKNEIVYFSLRGLSRIIKIDKKTRKVINNFGDKSPSGNVKYANNFFKLQHSPILLPNGDITVFSNNALGEKGEQLKPATVVVFSQPDNKDSCKITWEFNCNFDSSFNGHSYARGNAVYLENTNFLINMGQLSGRIFEVTKDKKIVWYYNAEKYSEEKKKWVPSCSYRVSNTKSLYPIYFTLTNSFNPDTINLKNNTEVSFNINNEGSNSDLYLVKYINDKTEIELIKTDTILPDKTKTIKVDLKDLIIDKQKYIKLVVSSITNHKFKREIKYWIDSF